MEENGKTEVFIAKATAVHGDEYDYSKVEYKNSSEKVIITCKKHGDFKQSPNKHLSGQGCPVCRYEKTSKNLMISIDEILERCDDVHGKEYDYSMIKCNEGMDLKYPIICKKHGVFYQTLTNHIKNKQGCPICGKEKSSASRRLGNVEFIKRSVERHGTKYDYSLVEYESSDKKVCIICPIHGKFWQQPNNHINGQGCPECGKEIVAEKSRYRSVSWSDYVKKANVVHNCFYDYSKADYLNYSTKIKIICPKHGEFLQNPKNHLNGNGCPECGKEKISGKLLLAFDEFSNRANEIHKGKYEYDEETYHKCASQVHIKCPEHGWFWQYGDAHLRGHGCPRCADNQSKAELEIFDYVKGLVGEGNVISKDRSVLKGREIDIFIPSMNIGIEYDGLYWHSLVKDKNYHLKKTEECEKKGIMLIHIFEDEYLFHKDLVLDKIRHALGKNHGLPKVYGRDCCVREIGKSESDIFLNENHIQGSSRSSVKLGCYFREKLVGVMTFTKEIGGNYELTRYASDISMVCCGVAGKLFSYFVKKYNPNSVKSFADRRWTSANNNNLYLKLGFEKDKMLYPNYSYVIGNKRVHKFNMRKNLLNKRFGLPLTMTESEMCEKLGFGRIWDCGLVRYVWKKR